MRLQEAQTNELPHLDFLTALVTDELEKRKERLLARRWKAARFPMLKTLDEFDFTLDFTEAQALGMRKQLVKDLVKPHRFIIDAFGMRNLPVSAAEDLREIFHRCYQLGDNIIATNSAILDRLMDNIHPLKITGRSYRVKSLHKKLDNTKAND